MLRDRPPVSGSYQLAVLDISGINNHALIISFGPFDNVWNHLIVVANHVVEVQHAKLHRLHVKRNR